MKKIYLLTLLSIVFCHINAQQVEDHMYKIDFFAPGFTYEKSLSQKTTFIINPALGGAIGYGGGETIWGLFPHINFEYRYYVNFKRRTRLNKKTSGNSGNFIAPKVSVLFPAITSTENGAGGYSLSYGAVYGLQRTYNNGIYILGEIGIGSYTSDFALVPLGAFKIGYVFNHSK